MLDRSVNANAATTLAISNLCFDVTSSQAQAFIVAYWEMARWEWMEACTH